MANLLSRQGITKRSRTESARVSGKSLWYYASAGEVIREALRDWRTREDVREIERARLQAAWRQGIESGAAAPFDLDAVKSAARERLG